MKRTWICLLAAAALGLAACSNAPSDSLGTPVETPALTETPAPTPEATPATEETAPAADTGDLYAGYVASFEEVGTMVRPVETEDGRALNLECTLDNEIDQLIYDHYRNELLGDLDASLEQLGETENYRITVKNDVKNVQDGAGMQSYMLHEMHIVPLEDVQTANENDLAVIAQEVADYGLTQWTVQAVDLSWTYTEAEKAKGPQLDEGEYQRYFLLGKAGDAASWKIYDFFWEDFLPAE